MREVRVYDEHRTPVWERALGPSEFAVFHVDAKSGRHRNAHGRRLASHWDRTCLVFGSLDEAEGYATRKVAENPSLACRIYDNSGGASGPVRTVAAEPPDPAARRRSAYRNGRWGALLSAAGVACFWYLWWTDWDSVLAGLFGSKFLTVGLVLVVQWWSEVRRFRRSSPAG